MSYVSGVVLLTSVMDEPGDASFDSVQRWLEGHRFGFLKPVDLFGGSKHPQLVCAGAGFNYFPDDEFVTFVMSIPWNRPEEVVLVIYPEHGAPSVWRPSSPEQIAKYNDEHG